jgi:hypothetical protein
MLLIFIIIPFWILLRFSFFLQRIGSSANFLGASACIYLYKVNVYNMENRFDFPLYIYIRQKRCLDYNVQSRNSEAKKHSLLVDMNKLN